MTISFGEIKTQFKKYVKLYKGLLSDKRTPRTSKIFLSLALGYLFLPFDLIPDFIPVLGQLDDILIVPGLIYLAVRLIPKSLYDEHVRKASKEDSKL